MMSTALLKNLLRRTVPWASLLAFALVLSGCAVLGGYHGWLAQGLALGIAALLGACIPEAVTETPNSRFARTASGPAPVFNVTALHPDSGGDGSAGWVLVTNQVEALGMALALGDINGDGLADVAVGAPIYNSSRGRVLVIKAGGTPLNAVFEHGELPSGRRIDLRGNATYANAGAAVAFVGDVNSQNPSMEDLAIGMPGDTGAPGTVALVFGSGTHTASVVLDDPFLGGEYGGRFLGSYDARIGQAVGSAGDLNGDGFTDLLIGGDDFTDAYAKQGRAYEARGRTFSSGGTLLVNSGVPQNTNIISDPTTTQYMGTSVAGNGDVNGDGFKDVAFGMKGAGGLAQGKVWVHLQAGGVINGNGSTANYGGFFFAGTDTYDYTGWSLAMEDIDGDGKTDLIIGAPDAAGVLPGATSLSGASVGAPGGLQPLAKGGGGETAPAGAGRVHVLFGRNFTPGSTILETDLDGSNGFTLVGGETGLGVGYAVARAGDVNGDGYPDFLITQENLESTGYAKAYVIFGGPKPYPAVIHLSELTANQGIVLSTQTPQANGFYALAGAGDFDGDDIPDIVLGQAGYDSNRGRVFMIFGKALR